MRLRVWRELQLPALRHPRTRHQRARQASPHSSYLPIYSQCNAFLSLFYVPFATSVVDWHRVDADPDPNPTFHFDADPVPDPDRHQNDFDPHVDPSQIFTHCFLLIAILYLHIFISCTLPHSPFCTFPFHLLFSS